MNQAYAPRPTLASALFPQSGLLRDALLLLGFSAVIALSAQVTIRLPFTPVPISGQTFAVLLAGAALGSTRGALAVLAYHAEALAGLPVYAGWSSAWTPSAAGVPYVIGPTAGYLAGFVPAAFAVGWLAERGWDRAVHLTAAAMVIGNLVIYACGAAVLTLYVGSERVLAAGVLPFLVGDIIKIALAALALPGAWRLVGRKPGPGGTP